MKKLLLALTFLTGSYFNSQAQNADLQIIHNCADPAADSVDIYVNGSLAVNDFKFRKATNFLSLPAGVTLNIGVAPGNSTSINDTLVNIPVQLVANGRYVAVASGVLNPAAFAANPNGTSTGFQLLVQDNIRAVASNPSLVDLIVLHGSTDAPTVDVFARGVAKIVDDASYTNFTNYISVPPANYLLDIKPGNDSTTTVATFRCPLTTAQGGAAVVFASGFLNPSANQNGRPFGLFVALPNGIVFPLAPITTARLQIIHNAADPAANIVDIYVNGALLQDDFAFRTATPFIDVPSGVVLNIGIAPGTSSSVNDTLVNIPVTLTNGEKYIAVANGVLNPANFAVNPTSISTGFQLLAADGMREAALTSSTVDLRVLHGATDAPAVDVNARNVAQIVTNAAYTDLTGYITVPAADYILDVKVAGTAPIVASFSAPLSTLGGGSAVVFASGFLTPSANQNGEAFGLFAALADGTVLTLAPVSLARLQVIHNAADPAANIVDVYVNGALLLDDFEFRTATPFIDVPAGVVLNIGIAPGTSTSVNDTIVNIPVTLTNGETYIAVANGVLNPANFAVNPTSISTGFQLLAANGMREAALTSSTVDLRVLHGATDAPAVDVNARNVAQIVTNAAYTDLTGYITVPAADYILDVKVAGTAPIVASFSAPLSTLGGGSAVVFASGFLTPSANQNGEAFGLFAALADGTVLTLAPVSLARLQVIHNAADPAADSVDVYVNGALLLDNFKFRTATPYIDVPADVTLNIGVAPGTSTSVNDTLVNFQVTLANNGKYLAVANGVLTPGNFAVNPDGRSTGFTLFLQDQMLEEAVNSSDVDFRAIHGATDAPNVDVVAVGVGPIVDNASYGDITNYISVPPAVYTLQVTPGNNNSIVVASYTANISSLAGSALVVFASGFLTPAANQNGAAFGLWVTLPDGTTFPLPTTVGINENSKSIIGAVYPNPATDLVTVQLKDNQNIDRIYISDMSGKLVSEPIAQFNGTTIEMNTKNLSSGLYMLTVESAGKTSTTKLSIAK